jgi:hypothetical protein
MRLGKDLLNQGLIENRELLEDLWGEEGFAGPVSEREARLRAKMKSDTLTLKEWSWEWIDLYNRQREQMQRLWWLEFTAIKAQNALLETAKTWQFAPCVSPSVADLCVMCLLLERAHAYRDARLVVHEAATSAGRDRLLPLKKIFGRSKPPEERLPFVLYDRNDRPAWVSAEFYDLYHESPDDEGKLEQFGIAINDY